MIQIETQMNILKALDSVDISQKTYIYQPIEAYGLILSVIRVSDEFKAPLMSTEPIKVSEKNMLEVNIEEITEKLQTIQKDKNWVIIAPGRLEFGEFKDQMNG